MRTKETMLALLMTVAFAVPGAVGGIQALLPLDDVALPGGLTAPSDPAPAWTPTPWGLVPLGPASGEPTTDEGQTGGLLQYLLDRHPELAGVDLDAAVPARVLQDDALVSTQTTPADAIAELDAMLPEGIPPTGGAALGLTPTPMIGIGIADELADGSQCDKITVIVSAAAVALLSGVAAQPGGDGIALNIDAVTGTLEENEYRGYSLIVLPTFGVCLDFGLFTLALWDWGAPDLPGAHVALRTFGLPFDDIGAALQDALNEIETNPFIAPVIVAGGALAGTGVAAILYLVDAEQAALDAFIAEQTAPCGDVGALLGGTSDSPVQENFTDTFQEDVWCFNAGEDESFAYSVDSIAGSGAGDYWARICDSPDCTGSILDSGDDEIDCTVAVPFGCPAGSFSTTVNGTYYVVIGLWDGTFFSPGPAPFDYELTLTRGGDAVGLGLTADDRGEVVGA